MAAPIPVNLVTGFLGTGKTTAIRQLLETHPGDERWAVLVNEFGEVGVDGALLDETGAVVQEVAGGCLCCVAAPAFTTGLNRLIRQQRPDRILIEPSGLGHPAQILETLTGPLYESVLEVRATLCVMDARQLSSPRHVGHEIFQDQIHLADVLVANKADLYSAADRAAFEQFVLSMVPQKQKLGIVAHGRIDRDWLDIGRNEARRAAFPEAHAFLVEQGTNEPAGHNDADHDWLLIEGHSDGYYRAGWLIRPHQPWPEDRLRSLLDDIDVERKKGIFETADGWRALNQADWSDIAPAADGASRLELIDAEPIDAEAIDRYLKTIAG